MARFRRSGMKAAKEVPLSEVKDDLSCYLREAETQESIGCRTIPGSCAGSSGREAACRPGMGSNWRTSKRSSKKPAAATIRDGVWRCAEDVFADLWNLRSTCHSSNL
jgi:hypothetical protein